MRKFLFLLLCWYLFTNASEKSEWWIELIVDPQDGTITKIKRSDYLEFIETNEIYETRFNYNKSLQEYTQKRKKFKKKLTSLTKT